MHRFLRSVFCAALFCLYPALVQAAAESKILGLFQRWQAAHGQRSGEALEGVYTPRLDYYGRVQTRERILSAKQALFARHPDFEQRIVAVPRIVSGDQEGRCEVCFVKQVHLDERLRNYPGLLLAERAGPGDIWCFVGESDEITRYAVDLWYTPLARGRFAGTEVDFAWVVAHAPNSAALCDEYEDCRCDLWSAGVRVPSKPLGSCTGAVLNVLGGLDDDGRERLQLLCTWWTSTWTKSSLLETRDGQWVQVLSDISATWDDAEAELVLYKADPQQPGQVSVTETVMDDEGDWSHRTRSEALRPVPWHRLLGLGGVRPYN